MQPRKLFGHLLALLALGAMPALAQEPPPPAQPPAADTVALVYEREAFTYPGAGRRDPFGPLTADQGIGPRFEELVLQGIIYSPAGTSSMAMLLDRAGKIHKVRRGEAVGNARVLEIGPQRVLFAVEDFGIVRQEMLQLQRKKASEGAQP